MNTSDIRKILDEAFYREVEPGLWVKPVGWCLFVYREGTAVWQSLYQESDGRRGRREIHSLHQSTRDTIDFDITLAEWESDADMSPAWALPGASLL